jgi:hypothetical protein
MVSIVHLPEDIITHILQYISIKKHHGQYSKIINVKDFINIESLLTYKYDKYWRNYQRYQFLFFCLSDFCREHSNKKLM